MTNIAEKAYNVFNSELTQGAQFSDTHEFPILQRCAAVPNRLLPIDRAARTQDFAQWIHFYLHDCKFECVWNKPKQYENLLCRFEGVISPDFSLYRDMPLAMQIYNTYRSRVLAYWLQSKGQNVIPNIRWGDERTYAFAFEGIPQGCTQNRSPLASCVPDGLHGRCKHLRQLA